jgi:hypothetical protein
MAIPTVEDQWKLFLERGGVTEEMLGKVQASEMKKAFYGAWGQCLISLREDFAELSPEEGSDELDKMMEEIEDFWLKQVEKENYDERG